MEIGVRDRIAKAGAEKTANAGSNPAVDRWTGRLPGKKTRRPAGSEDNVDRPAAHARLRHRLDRIQRRDGEKLCQTMRALPWAKLLRPLRGNTQMRSFRTCASGLL